MRNSSASLFLFFYASYNVLHLSDEYLSIFKYITAKIIRQIAVYFSKSVKIFQSHFLSCYLAIYLISVDWFIYVYSRCVIRVMKKDCFSCNSLPLINLNMIGGTSYSVSIFAFFLRLCFQLNEILWLFVGIARWNFGSFGLNEYKHKSGFFPLIAVLNRKYHVVISKTTWHLSTIRYYNQILEHAFTFPN